MKTTSAQDIWQTVRDLKQAIHEASARHTEQDGPNYAWVSGYMEGVLKGLPLTQENLKYLEGELQHLNRYNTRK